MQGGWSLIDNKLWAMESIKTILKFEAGSATVTPGNFKKRRVSANVPNGWTRGGRRISHQANVGVTDEKFTFKWAVRCEQPDVPFSPPPLVQAKLSQALSQIGMIGKEVSEPKEGENNPLYGILKWNRMDNRVIARQIFRDNKWAQRYLSIKEKAECLDFPNTRIVIMTDE